MALSKVWRWLKYSRWNVFDVITLLWSLAACFFFISGARWC
jgi:hypothetical protein